MSAAAWTPTGLYVVLRENLRPAGGWVVRVLNFATWQHREYVYADQAAAEKALTLWTL